MNYDEKWRIVEKLLSSPVYEDKLIGIEMMDDEIRNKHTRLEINEKANAYKEFSSEIWSRIYDLYHTNDKL